MTTTATREDARQLLIKDFAEYAASFEAHRDEAEEWASNARTADACDQPTDEDGELTCGHGDAHDMDVDQMQAQAAIHAQLAAASAGAMQAVAALLTAQRTNG